MTFIKRLSVPILLVLTIIVVVSAGISLGAAPIPVATVWKILANHLVPGSFAVDWPAGRVSIVWDVRFPRVLLGGLVGAGLALTGAVLQPATRNPLADPHLLGVSSGAAFGAILALLHIGMVFGLLTVPLFAFGGALLATATVGLVAGLTRSLQADRLALSGVIVGFFFTGLGNLLVFLGDPRATQTVTFWMLGGLGLAQWQHLIYPAAVLAAGLCYLLPNARLLNALAMGDETAATLGVPVARFRMMLFVISALITGTMVAFSGAIGFVGLMVPHMVRALAGSDNVRVLPLSALTGALVLILADLVARLAVAPEDMPIGIVTGLAGCLAFLWIMRKTRPGA
ncbi:FecCD family ABC transporter permease [Agrobacterium vitis]|uniref:FecCD family ABC transporter permease n=1 Tax=Agrobacterium vitis TaxID=373 RepID=UPI003D2E62E7